MFAPWYRTFSIHKEVSRGYVLLKIPFYTLQVSDLKVESWKIMPLGNELHILLQKEEKECPIEKILEEKRINYDRFLAYPGERLK
jgi:hypothetical protein